MLSLRFSEHHSVCKWLGVILKISLGIVLGQCQRRGGSEPRVLGDMLALPFSVSAWSACLHCVYSAFPLLVWRPEVPSFLFLSHLVYGFCVNCAIWGALLLTCLCWLLEVWVLDVSVCDRLLCLQMRWMSLLWLLGHFWELEASGREKNKKNDWPRAGLNVSWTSVAACSNQHGQHEWFQNTLRSCDCAQGRPRSQKPAYD